MAARTGSAEASLAVARFCELGGKTEMAIEQYCAAGDCAAAFALARHAACVPALAAWARRTGSAVAAALAAGHFEAAGQLAEAAELCALAGQPERAARLYIQASNQGRDVLAAVAAGLALATELRCCPTPGLPPFGGACSASPSAFLSSVCRLAATLCRLPSSWLLRQRTRQWLQWCWNTCRQEHTDTGLAVAVD